MDTTIPGYDWHNDWDIVEQSGQSTGNNELQEYTASQVTPHEQGLSLKLQRVAGRYVSGKIKSKKSLSTMAHEGSLEIRLSTPKVHCPGLWPALWLLPLSSAVGGWPRGGEIDLLEQMQREDPRTAQTAFSTLHFGPRIGADAIWDGHWGLNVASYPWSGTGTFVFNWKYEGAWKIDLHLDGKLLWEKRLCREGNNSFVDFEKGKHFHTGSAEEFGPRGEGDPAKVLSRAFEEHSRSMHIIVNLAFGGNPFQHVGDIEQAEVVVHYVKVT